MPAPNSALSVAVIMREVVPERPQAHFAVMNSMEFSLLMSTYVNGDVVMVYLTYGLKTCSSIRS